jgi:tetratricopeptide (TPR) repeat protein
MPTSLPQLDDLKKKNPPPIDQDDIPAKPVVTLQRYQELEQHLRNAPADGDAYLELTRIYMEQGRYFDAKRVLDKAMEHLSDDPRIVYEWEEMQVARSRQLLENAEELLKKEKTSAHRDSRDRCAIDLANIRIHVCSARMKRDPKEYELVLPLASSLRQLGRHQEAIDALKCKKDIPEIRARVCLQLGMALMQTEHPLEALAAFRHAALYRAPPPPEKIRDKALELATEVSEKLGLIDAARRYVKLRFEANPNDAILKQTLAKLNCKPAEANG